MSKSRKEFGSWGEQKAVEHLEANGYQIVDRNWRCNRGEVDIIIRDGEILAFVEVKTRRSRDFGMPEEGLTQTKAKRLLDLGQEYLAVKELEDIEWRIDLVAIEADWQGNLKRCEHLKNVVWGW